MALKISAKCQWTAPDISAIIKTVKGNPPNQKQRRMDMSKNELVAKIEALNEWEAVIEEAKAEAEAIRDSIKAEMMERDTEEMTAGKYIVRWTSVLSNRFDTTAFKKAHGELYKEYTKQSASRRFSISA